MSIIGAGQLGGILIGRLTELGHEVSAQAFKPRSSA